MNDSHLAVIAWAVCHEPTRRAYARCTGEDAAPVLDRYIRWVESNLIGKAEDVVDEAEAA